MRTSERRFAQARGLAVAMTALLVAWTGLGGAPEAAEPTFASPQAAYEQGLGAYRNSYYEIAIPALTAAAATLVPARRLFPQFYLARIYADNTGSHTDHIMAYTLFRQIAEEHADIDPDDRVRAPIVAQALTAVAGYVKRGLPEFGLRADMETAVDFFNRAATWFDEPDAQFELAKMHLVGEGVPVDVKLGLHYLQRLVQQSHAPAQAFLADLHWQSKFVPRDPEKALALIRMAVANAPRAERPWIDDVYQRIYCGTSSDVRRNSEGLVMKWKQIFARPRLEELRTEGDPKDLKLSRACRNGEPVEINRGDAMINAFTHQQMPPSTDTRTVRQPLR